MALALSNTTIVRSTIGPCANIAALISALHGVFTAAGWSSTTYLTTGHEYTLTSPLPQALSAKLRLYDPSDSGGWVILQMVGASGSPVGTAHKLNSSAVSFESGTLTYDVWANACQFFIGATNDCRPPNVRGGHSVAGGVPFALGQVWSGPCDEVPPPDTVFELWWSCGDTERSAFQGDGRSFRQGFLCPAWFSTCYNGILRAFSTAAHNAGPDLQLVPVRTAAPAYLFTDGLLMYHPVSGPTVYPDVALTVEPFLAWGIGDSDIPLMRAVLYDAALATRPYAADEAVETQEYDAVNDRYYSVDWHNFMLSVNKNGVVDNSDAVSYYTSLLLLTGVNVSARGKSYAH